MLLGQTLWVILVAYGCSFLGALQVPIFLATLTYALIGVILDLKSRMKRTADDADDAANTTLVDQMVSLLDCPSFYTTGVLNTPMTSPNTTTVLPSLDEGADGDSSVGEPALETGIDHKPKLCLDVQTPMDNDTTSDEETVARHSQSGIYFKALFLACIATVFYKHVWMLFVVFVPIFVFIANKAMVAFCVVDVVRSNWMELTGGIQVRCY